jgi:hypothetical protein
VKRLRRTRSTESASKIDDFFVLNSNEQCFVLIGKCYPRLGLWRGSFDSYTLGLPSEVKFDMEYVWENRSRIVGIIHTHPGSPASPSKTDYATFHAWVTALGKPFLCCILGIDGLRAHWFFDDESPHIEGGVRRIRKNLIVGRLPNG